jgi:hypothetical protein
MIMDATLMGYMTLDLDAAARRAQSIVDQCRRHGGQAIVCYHNSTLPGRRQRDHYRHLVDSLVSHSPQSGGRGSIGRGPEES